MIEQLIFSNYLVTSFYVLKNIIIICLVFYLGYKYEGGFKLFGDSSFSSRAISNYNTNFNKISQEILVHNSQCLKIKINPYDLKSESFAFNGKDIFKKGVMEEIVFLIPVYHKGQEVKNLSISSDSFILHFSTHYQLMVEV